MNAVEINVNLKLTIMTLKFPAELPVGAGTLTMKYQGEINNAMAGFYRSQYEDATGAKKWMGSTQFEALDARRAFPCWDEPARKATFTLSLTIPKESEALSNMPEARSILQKDGKTRKVTFLQTPKMSTYLLCWCVGEFDAVSALTAGGVLCKVFTPPGRGDTGRFALDVAVRTLELYDDFFRVPYPLEARHDRHHGLRHGRHGKLGLETIARDLRRRESEQLAEAVLRRLWRMSSPISGSATS